MFSAVLKKSVTSFLLVVLLGLSACSSRVITQVTTFSTATELPFGSSVVVVPGDKVDASGLEFEFYRSALETKLDEEGFTVEDQLEKASHSLVLSYGTARREKESNDRLLMTGGLAHGYGYYDRFGVRVIHSTPQKEFEYLRFVNFLLRENAVESEKADKLIEVKAVSYGNCEHLVKVFEPMLEAIFLDLWRVDGSVVKLKQQSDMAC